MNPRSKKLPSQEASDNAKSRLDLDDIHARIAKDAGATLLVSSLADSAEAMEKICYGVYQARRGWLEKEHVANTLSSSTMKKLLLNTD